MTPVPEDAERSVRELLSEITLNEDCLHHSSDAPLETIGIDSVGMIELVYALENRFSIQIGDDEVAPENFASIGSLTMLVARKCLS
jgi:acyl carrier protein